MLRDDKKFLEVPWEKGGVVPVLLRPLGWLYGLGMEGRNFLYNHGLMKIHKLSVPVIAIGNLTVGGTGKTPLTIEVVKGMLKRNPALRIGVLSRGYKGRQARNWVVSDGAHIRMGVRQSGDEPLLMARSLPGVKVFVGADRVAVGRKAVARYPLDVLILDDAFQHRRLFRDLNILVVDGRKGFEEGRVLPAGSLREFASNARRASCLVVTRGSKQEVVQKMKRYCVSGTPVFQAGLTVSAIREGISGENIPPPFLSGKSVWGVCGIAHPESFLETLKTLGVKIEGFTAFPDHYFYTSRELAKISEKAKAAGEDVTVVTTEKDWVKWEKSAPFPKIFVVSVRMTFINEEVYGFIEGFVYNKQKSSREKGGKRVKNV